MELTKLLLIIGQNRNSGHLLHSKRPKKMCREENGRCNSNVFHICLEREHLLSRILANRTVGFRRSKKESCSTRRGLRVGTNLVEFRQLQEVGIFSYLC